MVGNAAVDADARQLATVSITRRDLIASIGAVLADLIEIEEDALWWTKDDGEPQERAA
jgi:hypothetical protein